VAEGHDLDQLFSQGAVEKGVGLGAGDAEVFTGQVDRLIGLDGKVVVIDPIDGKGKLGRRLITTGLISTFTPSGKVLPPANACPTAFWNFRELKFSHGKNQFLANF